MAKKTEQNIFMEWLKSNIITLGVLATGMILAWAGLNARVEAIEGKVSQYPSQDWFELKFQMIHESIEENKKATLNNTEAINNLPQRVEPVIK